MKNYISIPYVIEQTERGERTFDLYSRLLEDRIIFLNGEITDELSNSIVGQLLWLETRDPAKEISLYINSPGGSVTAGMAIYDTINYIKCDVITICVGFAASMAAVLLASGTKGKRYALPSSEIMIHQVLGGARGQASDVIIQAKNLARWKDKLNQILSEKTGQSFEKVEKDTDRDNYMSAQDALDYGIIDQVYYTRNAS